MKAALRIGIALLVLSLAVAAAQAHPDQLPLALIALFGIYSAALWLTRLVLAATSAAKAPTAVAEPTASRRPRAHGFDLGRAFRRVFALPRGRATAR